MSRPKHYWFSISKKMIKQYDRLGDTKQEKLWKKAISQTFEEFEASENGGYKVKAVKLVLFNNMTYGGASVSLAFSERTIRRWVESFINRVGTKAGY